MASIISSSNYEKREVTQVEIPGPLSEESIQSSALSLTRDWLSALNGLDVPQEALKNFRPQEDSWGQITLERNDAVWNITLDSMEGSCNLFIAGRNLSSGVNSELYIAAQWEESDGGGKKALIGFYQRDYFENKRFYEKNTQVAIDRAEELLESFKNENPTFTYEPV